MKLRMALLCGLIIGGVMGLPTQAAPPEGKGAGHSAANSGKGNGNPARSQSASQGKGNQGNANPNKGNKGDGAGSKAGRGASQQSSSDGRGYDNRGRNDDYFDNRRRPDGRSEGLVSVEITAAVAREYALDYGLGGYSSLPPGIRKNLARGKPLPPGIAKKTVPGSLLGRLPRYPGYEWHIAGSDLILISVATAIVADILYDVFD